MQTHKRKTYSFQISIFYRSPEHKYDMQHSTKNPQKGVYNTIVLFIGGNDFLYGDRLTVKEQIGVAEELGNFINELVIIAEKGFFIGITTRGESTKHSVVTKCLIESLSRSAKWRNR